MKPQKFQWIACANHLPENPQEYLAVSYISKSPVYGTKRHISLIPMFNPDMYITNGVFEYAGCVVDYWSALSPLPNDAPLRYVEDKPAINTMLCD